MSITLAQVCDAVTATLGAALGIAKAESYDELADGVPTTPLLQVYPEAGIVDADSGTDRTTFQAGVRQTQLTIHADLYASQRSSIGEDMASLVDGIDALTDVLEAQDTKPYFGLIGLQAFRWEWSRVTFVYGDPQQPFLGARFMLTFWVF